MSRFCEFANVNTQFSTSAAFSVLRHHAMKSRWTPKRCNVFVCGEARTTPVTSSWNAYATRKHFIHINLYAQLRGDATPYTCCLLAHLVGLARTHSSSSKCMHYRICRYAVICLCCTVVLYDELCGVNVYIYRRNVQNWVTRCVQHNLWFRENWLTGALGADLAPAFVPCTCCFLLWFAVSPKLFGTKINLDN